MPVEKGNKVKVEYEGSFEDGTVFDSSNREGTQKPLEFEVGAGQVIKGFDDAVIGMEKGDEKEVTIQPSEGYGDINSELLKKFPRSSLPEDQEPKEGMMLIMTAGNGQQIPAKIAKVEDTEVTIDLNHPLAGKVLKFKIKVIDY